MTAILGELKDGKKVAVTDPKIMPSTVIYDVALTVDLPIQLTAVSGLNAMAHFGRFHFQISISKYNPQRKGC